MEIRNQKKLFWSLRVSINLVWDILSVISFSVEANQSKSRLNVSEKFSAQQVRIYLGKMFHWILFCLLLSKVCKVLGTLNVQHGCNA